MLKKISALALAALMGLGAYAADKPADKQTNKTAAQDKQQVGIIFIGNSITAGATLPDRATQAPPAVAARIIADKMPGVQADFTNLGVSGSTTLDWTPAQGKLFGRATTAADAYAAQKGRQIIFSISLGTNDSASSTVNGTQPSNDEFEKNMRAIIDSLAARYPGAHFVVNTPLWYSANTFNSACYLAAGQKRLKGYKDQTVKMVTNYRKKDNRIHMGNTTAWDFFREQTQLFTSEQGQAGVFYLHPNANGAAKLGAMWAEPIMDVIRERCAQMVTLPSGAKLYIYPAPSGKTDKAVVILPGGGYWVLASDHEGSQAAAWMNRENVTAFMLLYQMPHGKPATPNTDAREAVEYARAHAAELGGYDKVGIMGSSAGGHLASTVATHTNLVDFQILLYPVITMKPGTHQGSHDNLIGKDASQELVEQYSNEMRVTPQTPTAFIALSLDDNVVPAIPNGMAYVEALTRNKVRTTLSCYPTGGHGWGFRDGFTYSEQWKTELRKFLQMLK